MTEVGILQKLPPLPQETRRTDFISLIQKAVASIKKIESNTDEILGIVSRSKKDAPILRIGLIEPPECVFTIFAVRDLEKDVTQRIEAEALRNGIPSLEWVKEAVEPINLRVKEAIARRETEQQGTIGWSSNPYALEEKPRTDKETYGFAVANWYRRIAQFLGGEHLKETHIARSLSVVFEVRNDGRTPASNVSIELQLPGDLFPSVNHNFFGKPEVPDIPTSLAEEIRRQFPVRSTNNLAWYEPLIPRELEITKKRELSLYTEKEPRGFILHRELESMEHGMSLRSKRILGSFDVSPVRDFEVAYKLHASNQPEDSVGILRFHVREISETTSLAIVSTADTEVAAMIEGGTGPRHPDGRGEAIRVTTPVDCRCSKRPQSTI